ncbi:urea ABC transporter permease subunit UrtB [Bacillus mojavensis]|uniref:urea ABC transporter permease subunit UrtB n=1 Tax=Bacillus mojavensis TaxID=72360 RepID=UPI002DBCCDB4|nr:urea ABC transporter permease subunit UrtB [Bacillus mojavensis]MEC1290673.1 urea ABC transporter permease subunit UrtB [Bacillus mojavensis]MEC1612085.1 urea ABC transporter permease subunit UrtB [Bacillus mojavensis]MEC1659877.1 urea ABC transporter permease subunit UrtB [Bacillus mojavensis]MEC1685181.1 urea ABC transporter permease subunit UrtB [Bacillus mojavensis]MEC1691813.1 urea ABC transporter permease subunit UrtB [Bacillus mojavensis]
MSVIVTQLFNGISLGSILILIAIGLAVTFGLMNIINMAHGELIMAGAYTTYVVQQLFLSYLPASLFSYYFLIAIIMAFAVAAFIGIVIEKGIVRRLYDRPLDSLLATWGVSLILQQAARSIFGAPNVAVKSPEWLTGGVTLFSVTFPYKRLFILALVLFTLALLGFYLFKTSAGRRMQAVTLNRSMASCLGISVRKTNTLAFALGSGLAGIAGSSLTLLGSIGPTLGSSYLVDAFMIVILGGIGKLKGTIIGAVLVGLLSTFVEYSASATIAKVVVFAFIILFLQWRPSGLASVRTRLLD